MVTRPGAASFGWRGPVSYTTPDPVEEGGGGGATALPPLRTGGGACVSGGAPASDMADEVVVGPRRGRARRGEAGEAGERRRGRRDELRPRQAAVRVLERGCKGTSWMEPAEPATLCVRAPRGGLFSRADELKRADCRARGDADGERARE